jgi:hypothetical protein
MRDALAHKLRTNARDTHLIVTWKGNTMKATTMLTALLGLMVLATRGEAQTYHQALAYQNAIRQAQLSRGYHAEYNNGYRDLAVRSLGYPRHGAGFQDVGYDRLSPVVTQAPVIRAQSPSYSYGPRPSCGNYAYNNGYGNYEGLGQRRHVERGKYIADNIFGTDTVFDRDQPLLNIFRYVFP